MKTLDNLDLRVFCLSVGFIKGESQKMAPEGEWPFLHAGEAGSDPRAPLSRTASQVLAATAGATFRFEVLKDSCTTSGSVYLTQRDPLLDTRSF